MAVLDFELSDIVSQIVDESQTWDERSVGMALVCFAEPDHAKLASFHYRADGSWFFPGDGGVSKLPRRAFMNLCRALQQELGEDVAVAVAVRRVDGQWVHSVRRGAEAESWCLTPRNADLMAREVCPL